MSKIKSLPGQRLCSSLPPDRVPWETSDAIPRNGHRKVAPQPRALKALELALHIHTAGYNIYLSGESNLGRTYMLREFLEPRIRKAQTPPDLLYVNNFDDPDRPMLLSVPAGQGKKLAFLAGGETVVHLTGTGLGGRNQELALAAAPVIAGLDAAVFSVGSDGTDGPTDAAGGYVDGSTAAALAQNQLKVYDVLQNNDAYHALKAVDGLIITGATGTNVNDVAVVLIGNQE